jgi:alkyl hydroperoxide reductase subunit AhpF
MYDLLIVGGGSFGLTTAVYSTRKQFKALLVNENIGGQVSLLFSLT